MANTKISALTIATTPLAGTEVLPIVKSGITDQVTVANLTAGRAVSAASYSATGKAFFGGAVAIAGGSEIGLGTNTSTGGSYLNLNSLGNSQVRFYTGGTYRGGVFSTGTGIILANNNVASTNINISIDGGATNAWSFSTTGNLIPNVAAKGVNFTANTPAAGMTSQLLNWYEEGTWTPNQGAGLTLVGAFSSTGRYTRIGRQVSISGTVTGATTVALAAAGVITSNLPFTVVTAGHGDATNVAVNASATVICTGTSVTSASAIGATATITFSATYFV